MIPTVERFDLPGEHICPSCGVGKVNGPSDMWKADIVWNCPHCRPQRRLRATVSALAAMEDELARREENLASEVPDSPARQALRKDWEGLQTRKAFLLPHTQISRRTFS